MLKLLIVHAEKGLPVILEESAQGAVCETPLMIEEQKEDARGKRQSIRVIWSPDSKKFAMTCSDRRQVKDLWVINSLADPRPTIETYKYDTPGEENVTQVDIYIFDVERRDRVQVDDDRFKDQTASIHTARREFRPNAEGPQPTPRPPPSTVVRRGRDPGARSQRQCTESKKYSRRWCAASPRSRSIEPVCATHVGTPR